MTAIITAVVPVFNRVALVRPALAAVVRAAERHGGVEIVIVDNGSTDGAQDVIDSYADRATVLHATGSIAALRNRGAREGVGQFLCFLDSDVVVQGDYFVQVEALFASGIADAVGCEYHLPTNPCWSERVWHELTVRETDGFCRYLNSGDFAITRALFERSGGFPEDFETAEDSELCRRLTAGGARIYQSQTLAVQHLGNPKTVRGFYRRLRWHALQTRDGDGAIYLATRVALLDVGLIVIAGLFALLATEMPGLVRVLLVVAAVLALPTAVYVFRVRQVRRVVNPIAATFLIQVMFAARAAAFATTFRAERRGAATPTPTPSA